MEKVSFYFSAGDFFEALKRFDSGQPQFYQTHDELAKLMHEISDKYEITIFSLVTPVRQERNYNNQIKIIDLGEKDFTSYTRLVQSVREYQADIVIAHYVTPELLKETLKTEARIFPILASTDNKAGLRAWVRRRRLVSLLNHRRLDLVANHCMPATEQLGRFGVKREKLIAWDIVHPFHPASRLAKRRPEVGPFNIFYAGSVSEAKGVGDLIRALPSVLSAGFDIRCVLAGTGAVESMQALALSLGVQNEVAFAGMIPNSEVQHRMASADVVVIPSRASFPEGFPLTMFEAVASRTPILCSDHPVFRDLFVNGRDMAMFRGGDSASFASTMIELLTNSELYYRLSSNAEATWELLKGPADWRTLIKTWMFEGAQAPWIQKYVLSNLRG